MKRVSMFNQLLKLINKQEFSKSVIELKSDRYAKSFSSWDHMVSMMFCQLAQAKSLREISGGLQCCEGKLQHLGMNGAPKKSTLSHANKHRPWQLYQRVFNNLLQQCQAIAPKKKFRFKNPLKSLDATTIDLCLSMFDWAKFRTTKGAIKLHLLLDHDGYLPSYAHITEGKVHEVNIAHELKFPKGTIIAMDKGYTDYDLYQKWTDSEVWFVTRLKDNAAYEVVETKTLPQRTNIRKDEIIRLTGYTSQKKCSSLLRRVEVWDEEGQRTIILLTNHMKFAASTIASIYKDRWEIEQFFKALKQNLKIKTFVGTSSNAVHIQVWTALIAMLMLKYLQFKSKASWSLSTLVALLRWNLFTYRDLWEWIDKPYETPPDHPESSQILLGLDSINPLHLKTQAMI